MTDAVLIIDFGSQVTQLIARRVREAGRLLRNPPLPECRRGLCQAEAEGRHPLGRPRLGDRGRIAHARRTPCSSSGVPVLGICYGQQTMAEQLGGKVESGHHREFGRAVLTVATPSPLFEGVWQPGERYQVWMSHGDRVTQLARGF